MSSAAKRIQIGPQELAEISLEPPDQLFGGPQGR